MAFNTHLLDRIGAHTGIGGQKTFHVYTTTDSVATVSASGYFPSTEFKDGDVVFCSIPNQVYAYTVSISGSTVTVANAFGNLSPSTETFPTWTGTPVPADGGWGVGYAYDLSPYLTDADSISISGEPAWMTVSGLLLVGVPNATGTTSNIIITPTNTNGDGPTETVSVTIDALAPTWNTNTPTISWAAASDPDHDFTQYINSNGGDASITYAEVSSSLPASLTLNTVTPGVTDGTLSASAGNYSVIISATNSGGTRQYTFPVTITVTPVVAPTWGAFPNLDWTEGQEISIYLPTFVSDGGGEDPADTGDFTYTIDADIPSGVDISGLYLAGTVAAGAASGGVGGEYTPVITATNSADSDTVNPTITVSVAGSTTAQVYRAPDTGAGLTFTKVVQDLTPRVQFFKQSQDVNEADGSFTVTVVKLGKQDAAINQNIVVPETDYTASATPAANLGTGDTSLPVVIDLIQTAADEGGASPVLAFSANSATDGNTTTTINITDSGSAVTSSVQFSVTSQQVTEGTDPAILIERVGGGTEALTQNIVVPANSGYLVADNYTANLGDSVNSALITLTGAAVTRSGDQNGSGDIPLTFTANGQGNTTLNLRVIDSEPTPLPSEGFDRIVSFDSGTLGSTAESDSGNTDDFDWNDGSRGARHVYDNTHTFNNSTYSAKFIVPAGDVFYAGRPGFLWPKRPWEVGTKIWIQTKMWFTQGFFDAGGTFESHHTKFIRFGITSNDTNSLGLYQWSRNNTEPATMHWKSFAATDSDFNVYDPASGNLGAPIKDQWNTYEIYIEVGYPGAKGVTRIWKDHNPCLGQNLIYPDTGTHGTPTYDMPVSHVRNSGDSLNGANEICGQWNGDPNNTGTSNSFDLWNDEWRIVISNPSENIEPVNTDSRGKPFIGRWENP